MAQAKGAAPQEDVLTRSVLQQTEASLREIGPLGPEGKVSPSRISQGIHNWAAGPVDPILTTSHRRIALTQRAFAQGLHSQPPIAQLFRPFFAGRIHLTRCAD